MKILFISDLYPVKDDEKTTPKTLLNFVKEWQKSGHKVDVIKPNFILNSFLRRKPFYKTGQYGNVFNVNYFTPFWFDVKRKLRGFIFDYDIVVAHMPSGILFADKLGMPFVAGVHNSDLTVLTKFVYKFHFKNRLEKALDHAKNIACRSFVIKDKLIKLFPKYKAKTFVASSGIDKNIIEDFDENRFLHEGLRIFTCANFKKRKNIDLLIKACKGLEGVKLVVAGDGNLRKSLEKIDRNVEFTGYLSPKEVLAKMRESDVFVLPSVGETFGMVYLEAMSQGCITVCTKHDGVDGIIKDGENGFLVEPEISSIRDLILKIKNSDVNSLITIEKRAFETVKYYTSEQCAENYLQQIFKIL